MKNPVEVYKEYSNKLPVIDIGCGTIRYFNFDYVRFDKAVQYVMWGGMNIVATHYGDFHDMSQFKDNQFEYVISHHSLEHAKHPKKAVLEWTRILNVNGIMYISYPTYLDKITPEEKCKTTDAWEDAISKKDLTTYQNLGGKIDWLAKDYNGNIFLDTHYNIYNVDILKSIFPKNLELIYEETQGETVLVYKKIS